VGVGAPPCSTSVWYSTAQTKLTPVRFKQFTLRLPATTSSRRVRLRTPTFNPPFTHHRPPIDCPLPLHTGPLPSSRLHFFPISDMSNQSESSRFPELFESALQDYEQKTKIKLDKHPLAEKLEQCHTIEGITRLLQEQAGTLVGSDKIMKSIEGTVRALHKISGMADSIGLVRRKALVAMSYISHTYSTALCKTNTYRPWYHTRSMYLSQVLTCVLL